MSSIPKLLFHNQGAFLKSLKEMRRSGGPKQQAADQVAQIIGDFTLNGSTLAKLTNWGESRIPHCVKYDLRGACRLVTVQNDGCIWFLFVGDHEETDRWIEAHPGLTVAADRRKKIHQPIVSSPGTTQLPSQGVVATTDDRPLLDRILFPEFDQVVPQAKLRRDLREVREDTDDDTIQEIVECIADFRVQSLMIDLFTHLRKGEIDPALTRIDIHFGRAIDVVTQPTSLDDALATGENSELVTDLTSLSPGERERLLSDDFEPWLLWLHPEQKRVVEADFDGPAMLKGVSGSGKTVILIHRARRLARKYPDQTIGVLTLNRSLARLLQNLINKLCVDGEHARIKVEAFYDYFQSVLRHLGGEDYLNEYLQDVRDTDPIAGTLRRALTMHQSLANDFSPGSGETLEDTWDEYWQLAEDEFRRTRDAVIEAIKGRGEYDVKAYLRDEFTLIRSAFPRTKRNRPGTGESYYEYKREGRAIGLPEGTRRNVLRMLMRYEEYMLAGAMMDELALSQAILPARSRLRDLPDSLRRRCLLVDEFQDFSTLELSLLKQIPSETENGLFLTGDTVQKVMVKDFNLGAALLDRNYVRTRTITKNYRNSRQILLAAHSLVKHYGAIAAKHEQNIELLDPELAVRETAPPIAIKAVDSVDVAWKMAREWVSAGNRESWSVCIVTANTSVLPPARILELRPHDIAAERLSGDYVLHREKMMVGTLAEVKGFEFSLIVIVGCDKESLPDRAIPEDEQWRDALRLYVAMTRGRDQVAMIYQKEPSAFLDQMKDHLVWRDDEFTYSGPRCEPTQTAIGPGSPRVQVPTVVVPKVILPAAPWPACLSSTARLCLLRYFEQRVYVPKNGHHPSPAHMRQCFERWLTPKNVDGIAVSRLFGDGPFRRDLAQEIHQEIGRHGFKLVWDR
jgi:superfamily I DNA/RNA helicase